MIGRDSSNVETVQAASSIDAVITRSRIAAAIMSAQAAAAVAEDTDALRSSAERRRDCSTRFKTAFLKVMAWDCDFSLDKHRVHLVQYGKPAERGRVTRSPSPGEPRQVFLPAA